MARKRKKMYFNFCEKILETNDNEISKLLSKNLSHQKTAFDWIVKNNDEIIDFKEKLKQNVNFKNRAQVESVFLKKTIEFMTMEKDLIKNFSRSLFIIKNYTSHLNKNAMKTLIKYSFLKWNK